MLWAPSGAGTRVSAFLRGRKKQLLGSILLRQDSRLGVRHWNYTQILENMYTWNGDWGVGSRECGKSLTYPPLPPPHSPPPLCPLPLCPNSRANGLLFCQPVRPERRKFSSRRMVISQKIGSMSIARHLRPV